VVGVCCWQIKFDKLGMPTIEDVVGGLCAAQVEKVNAVDDQVTWKDRLLGPLFVQCSQGISLQTPLPLSRCAKGQA
jgi:hypothetical protein